VRILRLASAPAIRLDEDFKVQIGVRIAADFSKREDLSVRLLDRRKAQEGIPVCYSRYFF